MRRLLRTLGAGRHPDARASFFLSPLAELLPRDGEKRRKVHQRSRKGRLQPESARETGRVGIRARNSFFLLGLRFPGLSGARLRKGEGFQEDAFGQISRGTGPSLHGLSVARLRVPGGDLEAKSYIADAQTSVSLEYSVLQEQSDPEDLLSEGPSESITNPLEEGKSFKDFPPFMGKEEEITIEESQSLLPQEIIEIDPVE
ncbi:hypothetical protein NDU88_002581 [Pleurodeles waltl]|uniref:Uncharacterized protein n=1 Tax=Pleurodeles waltl TaxID=8319 RepID=A0AAV7RBE3_PLEWA|nr:hypothetical protein NDU88_002581 [Pleurodeles waltl]